MPIDLDAEAKTTHPVRGRSRKYAAEHTKRLRYLCLTDRQELAVFAALSDAWVAGMKAEKYGDGTDQEPSS